MIKIFAPNFNLVPRVQPQKTVLTIGVGWQGGWFWGFDDIGSSLGHRSLHNRRAMCQVRQTRHFARSARRWAKKKIKRLRPAGWELLAPVHSSGSSSHLRLQMLTDGGDVKRTNENTIHCSKIVIFLATRNVDSSINHRK